MTRVHHMFQVLTALVLLSAAAPTAASAQEPVYRLDLVSTYLGSLPGFENLSVSDPLSVNVMSQGDVLFENAWSSDTGEFGFALWLWSDGTVTPLAMRGLPAPGTSGEAFGEYDILFSRAAPNGDVTFISRIGPDTTVIDQGLWAGPPSALSLVARTGETAPGSGGLTFQMFQNGFVSEKNYGIFGATMNSLGEQAFRALIGDPLVCNPACGSVAQEGIWRNTLNGLELVARSGEAAPGLSGESFTTFPFYVLNSAGEVATVAVTQALPSINGGDGIWVGQPGALLPVAVRGEPAPGTGGLTFARFFSSPSGVFGALAGGGSSPVLSGPVTNGAGDIVFFAALATSDETREIGLWVRQAGLLQLLAREGDPAPAGEDGIYGMLDGGRLRLNDAGQFAFTAALENSTTSSGGLWLGQPDSLALAVATGEEVPGFQPAPLDGIINFDLNDSGALAFTGIAPSALTPPFASAAWGAWISSTDGISPILQAGDVVEMAPGAFQTVLEVHLASDFPGSSENGSSRMLSETGDVGLIVFFCRYCLLLSGPPD